jgi:hypothetical protein
MFSTDSGDGAGFQTQLQRVAFDVVVAELDAAIERPAVTADPLLFSF